MIFDTISPSVTDGKRWANCVKDHAEGQFSLTAFTSLCRENKFMLFVKVCMMALILLFMGYVRVCSSSQQQTKKVAHCLRS